MSKDYKKGMIIKGQVTGIEKYGIFVNVDFDYSGLIHISEISDGFVRNVSDYVSIGETIYVKIVEVDDDNLQLKLSIKNINYKIDGKKKGIIESISGFCPLADNLDIWINEKLAEIHNESEWYFNFF